MQSNQNSPLSTASQFHQNPAFLGSNSWCLCSSSCLPSLGCSSITHLLNKSPPSLFGPSTQALVRSLKCPPDDVRSLQIPKEHVTKAQTTPKILKTICETITGNIGHWNLALDFMPNKRGKTACRKELAELIATNEKMTIYLFLKHC